MMRERYKAKNPKSWMLRTHAQTAGVSLTAQEPTNNVARVTIQAMAAIMGGTNSLHTNSMDETLSLPTEQAVKVALRTQQIIAEESGIGNTADPLGGSWLVESLTTRIEKEALDYIKKLDDMGGMINAVNEGFPQKEIAVSAYKFQQQLDRKEKVIVGVNKYADGDDKDKIPTLVIDHKQENQQIAAVKRVKANRNTAKLKKALDRVRADCRSGANVMPSLVDAAKAYASLGEICDIFRAEFGIYRDPANF
jgi:methylmalonyl-CoA mutase N-terminal domain/subunit